MAKKNCTEHNELHATEEQQPGISGYNCKQLLELLSTYEGELQARDSLIESLQKQQQTQLCSSSLQTIASASSYATVVPRDAVDSLLFVSKNSEQQCSSCGSRMLQAAKMLQIQRDCDKKMSKALTLLQKRHEKIAVELDLKERRLQALGREDEKYTKELEVERDQLVEQLKHLKSELSEMVEQKADIEDLNEEERERQKSIVLYLMDERRHMLSQMNQLQQQLDQYSSSASESPSTPEHQTQSNHQQIGALRAENKKLKTILGALQSDNAGLQKRMDYLLKDLQHNAFHQQFQFLQPKGSAEKELYVVGNGIIPPLSSDHKFVVHGPNRIRNSTSFPQIMSGANNELPPPGSSSSGGGRLHDAKRMPPLQFPTNQFEQRHGQPNHHQQQQSPSSTAAVPLMASHSTMVMRWPPPMMPKTSAQQQQQHQYRRHATPGSVEQMGLNVQQMFGQPQTVLTRRSSSLPRRVISSSSGSNSSNPSSTTATMPPSGPFVKEHRHRKEPSADHIFYHQQQQRQLPPMEDKFASNNNNFI